MGLNISAYILKDRIQDENNKWFETETFNDFDSGRCAGDSDFVVANDIKWIEEQDDPDASSFGDMGRNYCRPKDIDQAIKWVNTYIETEGNKKRLIDLLEEMRKNSRLFIYCSW